MLTSTHGRSGGAGRASVATRAATSSTSAGSGHNRRMASNLAVAAWLPVGSAHQRDPDTSMTMLAVTLV